MSFRNQKAKNFLRLLTFITVFNFMKFFNELIINLFLEKVVINNNYQKQKAEGWQWKKKLTSNFLINEYSSLLS